MKRILILFLALFVLCSCTRAAENEATDDIEHKSEAILNTDTAESTQKRDEIYQSIDDKYVPEIFSQTTEQAINNTDCMSLKGIWLAIYELAPDNSNKESYAEKADEIMKNISSFGLTDAFVQVRANCDAIYKSSIFPACYMYAKDGELYFDALEIICEKAHKYGVKVHAWVNPYRVCADSDKQPVNIPKGIDKSQIYAKSKAYYLNPCDSDTDRVILEGIREIIENYDVDGVHIDDYFYPTQDEKIDKTQYDAYIKAGGSSTLDDFRRDKVSSLVSSIYTLVKSKNQNLIFSVSPSADIEKNFSSLYADVSRWSTQDGYCDIIIPQIYFGFDNEALPFKATFDRWKKLTENSRVRLCAGLAVYKSGKEDKYAGENGKNEWIENSDIIKRQVEYLEKCGAYGYCLFSYNYVFENKFTNTEVKNLKSVI